MRKFLLFVCMVFGIESEAQNIVTYAGNSGKEIFYEVTQISNGTFLVSGSATNMTWLPASVNTTTLSITSQNGVTLNNALGTNKIGFILNLSQDMQTILSCVQFPAGAVEDISRMKFSSLPYAPTGNLFISGNTRDTKSNDGGYFIAQLNANFINGVPSAMVWAKRVWAEGETFINQPWDVGSDGKVVYITGQSHAADWCQVARLNTNGTDELVPNWRIHWDNLGNEFRDIASNYTGSNTLVRSGIVLKRTGRCELRSTTQADFDLVTPDGNGGTKKGKWPMDFLYNAPCNTMNVSTTGPGYNGYKASSTQTYAGLAVAIDRRDNSFFIGMNTKSVINSSSLPDFEPAVMKMDASGALQWWSRLYHEIKPNNDTVLSTPDQYIDGLCIDYLNNQLVVNARCHGNNTNNLWNGMNIPASPGLTGFQKQWTGTNGNIHISWLGKLELATGTFKASTFIGEYNNTTTGLGSAHPDPNLDNWPNPNQGWPNLNTTRIARNAIKVATDGSVYLAGVGRRTITTANAHQKMVKQLPTATANNSTWNQFIRAYSPNLDSLRYSSLIVGNWDTITGNGGDNTTIFSVHKSTDGIVAVGRKVPNGNEVPLANVPTWGTNTTQDTSALLVYYKASNLLNANDLLFFNNAPLPIGIELNGTTYSDKNSLFWRVANTDNVISYNIERGSHPNQLYTIAQVPAEANKNFYTYDDKEILSNTTYYRITALQNDGSIAYSNNICLHNNKDVTITVLPNPTSGNITLQSTINLNNADYIMVDYSGRVVAKGKLAGNNLNITDLATGTYILQIFYSNKVFGTTIIKE